MKNIYYTIVIIFEFVVYLLKNIFKKIINGCSWEKILIIIIVIIFTFFVILGLEFYFESDISSKYANTLKENNNSINVKCYATEHGLRTKAFRLYKAHEYRIINVILDKYDIYPKNSNKNGFYLGKCDLLKNEINDKKID